MLEQIGEVEGLFEKEKDEDEEENQEKVGTPFYLAPELWLNKPNTKASDIWALGVILYELCVQRFPWQATEMDELEQKVLNEKFTPLPNYVRPEFQKIIKNCLQKKEDKRPTIDDIIMSDIF